MGCEISFRITQAQVSELESTIEALHTPIFALCGHGTAQLSESCNRESWSSQGAFLEYSSDEQQYGCVFAESLAALYELAYKSAFLLWGYIENGHPKVFSLADAGLQPIAVCAVVGSDLYFEFEGNPVNPEDISGVCDINERTFQAFGSGTTQYLSNLTIGVAGASGTGSIVIEQLVRLGVKRLVIVDDDTVETRNIGRIINSSLEDVKSASKKVDMLKSNYERMGLNTEITAIPSVILCPEAIHKLSQCDIVFGCLDSVDGRMHLNRISTFYCIPYIDLGVKLVSLGGEITTITGAVHYLVPGGSSLRSRNVYSDEQLTSQSLRRQDPIAYQERLNEKYIEGAAESSPAVISVNMQVASLGVLEFLNRIHPYRDIPNSEVEAIYVDLRQLSFSSPDPPSSPDMTTMKYLGSGDISPLLNLPSAGV